MTITVECAMCARPGLFDINRLGVVEHVRDQRVCQLPPPDITHTYRDAAGRLRGPGGRWAS